MTEVPIERDRMSDGFGSLWKRHASRILFRTAFPDRSEAFDRAFIVAPEIVKVGDIVVGLRRQSRHIVKLKKPGPDYTDRERDRNRPDRSGTQPYCVM